MVKTKREQFLFSIVIIAALIVGGFYLYKQVGEDSFLNMDARIEEKKAGINSQLDIQVHAVQIKSRYDAMKSEMLLEGNNPKQYAEIRKSMTQILSEVGIKSNQSNHSISQKEPKMEENFKIASININQLRCTPQQLGQLLYKIEKQSNVMEVENCRINNLISEVGKTSMIRGGGTLQRVPPTGMLDVDMQISRLIEYRKGEKPKKRR
jgi:hypothetical protein